MCDKRLARRKATMKFRSVSLALVTCFFAPTGCASAPEQTGASEDAIVDVAHTDVERQSIGNCWLYAHASWAESMHKTATGEDFDVSQSYWTYWHWFDQITRSGVSTIQTGGNWSTANGIVSKYGLMAEKDFIDADTLSEMSSRQKQALDSINEELKSGELSNYDARRDKATVRRVLDRAWRLPAEKTAMLDQVFGASVSRTFSASWYSADASGTPIIKARAFDVAYASRPGGDLKRTSLETAMYDWRQVYYSRGDRSLLLKVQEALHDAQPVIISWFVDFNAMENRANERMGSFNISTLAEFGPGSQGGHMTVLEDYEATLEDGTLLKAGVTLDPSNPDEKSLLDSALAPSTEIKFLRVKNSWGGYRPDRAFSPGMPGYHDLYLEYLDGPVKRCATKSNGDTDTTNCPTEITPLQYFIMPPGY